MKKSTALVLGLSVLFLFLLSPVLFRKYSVPLTLNGRVTAIARRPLALPWHDNEFSVYVEGSKVFGLWGDAWDDPVLIYPFSDNKRFLCISNDDTSVLVFVVDLNVPPTAAGAAPLWPANDYLRNYMTSRMKEVVMHSTGLVRLPTSAEVSEASRGLAGLTPEQLQAHSFPQVDLGIYRAYWPKSVLLSALASNRDQAWP